MSKRKLLLWVLLGAVTSFAVVGLVKGYLVFRDRRKVNRSRLSSTPERRVHKKGRVIPDGQVRKDRTALVNPDEVALNRSRDKMRSIKATSRPRLSRSAWFDAF